ncbi:MAG: hypothetical protein QOE68_1169, partial [Thermoanaerobaculia bacterium]|nr:hypothetical protein [Thermoanaerobaculia bacterium]
KPNNPDFAPLVFTDAPDDQFAVIGEFLEVISPSGNEPQMPEQSTDAKSGRPASSAERTEAQPASRRARRGSAASAAQGSFLDSVPSSSASAARPQAHEGAPEPPDRDELICVIRQLFTTGGPRDRETAIQDLKAALGYQRLGSRIRETLDNAFRTAVRRGVLTSDGDSLFLQTRSIDDYERSFLKDQFLASLEGRTWKEREDAIRDFARWLGFRRTGPNIDETARSLINGLIREGRLESQAALIRRAG